MDAFIISNLGTLLGVSVKPDWSVADLRGTSFLHASVCMATWLSSPVNAWAASLHS